MLASTCRGMKGTALNQIVQFWWLAFAMLLTLFVATFMGFDNTAKDEIIKFDYAANLEEESSMYHLQPAALTIEELGDATTYSNVEVAMEEAARRMADPDAFYAMEMEKIDERMLGTFSGSTDMLTRCMNYVIADPDAEVPVEENVDWAGKIQIGKTDRKISRVAAVDLAGHGKLVARSRIVVATPVTIVLRSVLPRNTGGWRRGKPSRSRRTLFDRSPVFCSSAIRRCAPRLDV